MIFLVAHTRINRLAFMPKIAVDTANMSIYFVIDPVLPVFRGF